MQKSVYLQAKQMGERHERTIMPVDPEHDQRGCDYCEEGAQLAVNCYLTALEAAPSELSRDFIARKIARLYADVLGD